mmetsp:Transcript_3551/g.12524  ORF Transcript_3551/g.12524 Transcript_3551/m.12524 type:complete len:239 (+) Transcript_3551:1945-2661(+)
MRWLGQEVEDGEVGAEHAHRRAHRNDGKGDNPSPERAGPVQAPVHERRNEEGGDGGHDGASEAKYSLDLGHEHRDGPGEDHHRRTDGQHACPIPNAGLWHEGGCHLSLTVARRAGETEEKGHDNEVEGIAVDKAHERIAEEQRDGDGDARDVGEEIVAGVVLQHVAVRRLAELEVSKLACEIVHSQTGGERGGRHLAECAWRWRPHFAVDYGDLNVAAEGVGNDGDSLEDAPVPLGKR